MINMNEENEKMFHDGFRLLNSEIGNDLSCRNKRIKS